MSALISFERIMKAPANTSMSLVCVIAITLLTTSCSTAPTKQTASAGTTANSLTTRKISDDELQNIECRTVSEIGTRLKRKVCEFKETWAAIDKANSEKSGEFKRKIDEQSGIVNPQGRPASTTISNTAITSPMGE